MKKIFSIGLGLLLVISTIGVTINKHYSGGKLFSYSLFGEADSCCEVNCECCDEDSTTIQVEDNFVGTSFDLVKTVLYTIVSHSIQDLFRSKAEPVKKLTFIQKDKAPPPHCTEEEYTQIFLL